MDSRSLLMVCVAGLIAGTGAAAAADGLKATFPVPPGFRAEAFATEPMFANPVAISVDADGSVYVTETRRRKANALDIRQNPDWLNHDLSFTNVAMKEAFYRDRLSPENSAQNRRRVDDLNGDGSHDWRDLTVLSEAIHRLRDTDGDGRADRSTVFAEGFNTIVTDVAAGVLARGRDVYATIAPDLWKLTDTDGDGQADQRRSLAAGFAVHIAYAGHNMHGPTMGPDGRIYWSIADIGSNHHPHEGAIFRIDPGGENFEVFARGLRNPHEFVFNELGDLFTADNDSDNGDRERWLHIVEGADYGWRNSWQYQIGKMWGANEDTYPLWNEERLWHLWFPEQAAWILPPAAHVGPGPCGMKFYPGGALDEAFGGRILLAEFTGAAGSSTVNVFTLAQNGATYDVADDRKFLTSIVATGLDFAPDGGALFVADWAGGWDLNNQGRVWKLFSAASETDPRTLAARELLTAGFSHRPEAELAELLGHGNLNVRREAQFALADKRAAATLSETARKQGELLPRIHALWGLEQIHRKAGGVLEGVADLLNDRNAEVRAQTAKMLGEGRVKSAAAPLAGALNDPSPRVQFFAAMALGKLRDADAVDPIHKLLARNGKTDKHLRYAGIRALELIGDLPTLTAAAAHTSADVRLASVVALRRLERPEVAVYLNDADPLVVVEAARAINDVPINSAMPQLAALIDRPLTNAWLARRVLNANFRLGGTAHVTQLATFAADNRQTDAMRREAIRLLGDWAQPNPRDHVVGAWRPLTPSARDTEPVKVALREKLPGMLTGSDEVRAGALKLAGSLGIQLDGQTLLDWVTDLGRSADARINALEMLADNGGPQFDEALGAALNASSNPPEVYAAALKLLAHRHPEDAAAELNFVSRYRLNSHMQAALGALSNVASTNLNSFLATALAEMQAGTLDGSLRLDVLAAARARDDEELKRQVANLTASLSGKPLGELQLALSGGDARRGRRIFFEKAETECLRCHRVTTEAGVVGGDAGPDLTGLGSRVDREYLLAAIVEPNREFAPGYEQVSLTLKDGGFVTGRVLKETAHELTLEVPLAGEEDFL
ncbi:MAG TPA: hypothetical protein DCY13_20940, partial [Verrucomicrobiales bacterium]|nr:hypothetical protein [Verrucomicrobiales bacterium]